MMVGYPRTPYFSHNGLPPVVQSTSAMRTFFESSKVEANESQSGFIFLQWPHQGARNLMKAALPDLRTSSSKLSGVSSIAPADAPAAAQSSVRERSAMVLRAEREGRGAVSRRGALRWAGGVDGERCGVWEVGGADASPWNTERR